MQLDPITTHDDTGSEKTKHSTHNILTRGRWACSHWTDEEWVRLEAADSVQPADEAAGSAADSGHMGSVAYLS
jgi:hypothetical protein